MCDETTNETHDLALAARGLTRREFAALGAAAALSACASNGNDRPGEQELVEETVRITTADGIADAFFVHPAKGKWPGVIMWPDIAGLREAKRIMARRLASAGHSVLVVNQYYRSQPAPVFLAVVGRRVVVQQHVGGKQPVGDVIHHQQAASQASAQGVVPAGVEGVMVDNHPVRRRAAKCGAGVANVLLPSHLGPGVVWWQVIGGRRLQVGGHGRQPNHRDRCLLQNVRRHDVEGAHQHHHVGALFLQGLRQRKTPPKVAGAHGPGCIHAQCDTHAALQRCSRRRESASNISSARSQSSGVSMSCTRLLGRMTGAESLEKMALPASQA